MESVVSPEEEVNLNMHVNAHHTIPMSAPLFLAQLANPYAEIIPVSYNYFSYSNSDGVIETVQ